MFILDSITGKTPTTQVHSLSPSLVARQTMGKHGHGFVGPPCLLFVVVHRTFLTSTTDQNGLFNINSGGNVRGVRFPQPLLSLYRLFSG